MKQKKIISRRRFLILAGQGLLISTFMPFMLQASSFSDLGLKHGNTNWFLNEPNAAISQMKLFTDVYQKHSKSPKSLRELECLKVQQPMYWCEIQENDLFAGRELRQPIGFLPQAAFNFGYYCEEDALSELMNDPKTTAANKQLAKDMIAYWKTETSNQKFRDAYPLKMKQVLNSDKWGTAPNIASPLYRMAGTQMDFDKLIRLGVIGLKNEITSKKKKVSTKSEAYTLYENMENGLILFGNVANTFADQANKLSKNASSDRKKDLLEMERILRKIATEKPQTMREAIQLMFLYVNMAGSYNYGRMDEYLGDLYVNDLKNGTLTEEEAIRLVGNLWKLIDAKDNNTDGRVIVGGKGRRNEINADKFALMAMEATRVTRTVCPQFTLRFYKEQNPSLYEKALDVIATGNPYPIIYNDEVNIPSVISSFKIPYEEAIHYLPYGCGEYILNHRSVGTPSGVINLLQALTVTLNNGINPVSKIPMGVSASELGSFETFDAFFKAYKKNVELYVEQLAYQEKLEYDIAGQVAPFLFLSMAYDDCIQRGKGIFEGGVRYLGGTLESYGNTNASDGLTAIKKLVYEDKKITLDQLREILAANFEGYEMERKMMLEVPKYGNDDNYADSIKVEVDCHVCTTARNMSEKVGLDSYLIVVINNSANVTLGEQTAASPDGRKAFTFMANGNAPTGGADISGVTAFLNSVLKPDTKIHAGAVQNMKFSKEMMNKYRTQTDALLKTYWEKGGAQCMINCIGRGDLEDAMKNPTLYADLIVRVGGFSYKFVDLPKNIQLEILSRTMY